MRTTVLVVVVAAAVWACAGEQATPPPPPPVYVEGWFEQELSHFDFASETPEGKTTFGQRYLYSGEHYVPGGPILFYTGNEGDIVSFWNNTGLIFEYAAHAHGFVLMVEHRFFGQTLPFGPKASYTREALQYCSSQQALADYAVVLAAIQRGELLADVGAGLATAPVIAMGGSYGGMLAGWFRVKYPALVAGALAASAPILEFEGLMEPDSFMAVATADFAQAAAGCDDVIRNAYKVLPGLAKSASGRAVISDALRTCKPVETEADVDAVFSWSQNAFLYMAMLDYPSPSDFLRPMPPNPVNVSCAAATAASPDAPAAELLAAFGQAAGVYWNGTGAAECFDLYAPLSPNLGNMMGWDWLACTMMVFPQAQTGTTDMFWPVPWNLTAYSDACYAQFGVRPRPFWAQTYYGSNDLSAASNIIFSNGVLDPWISGGVLKAQSPSIEVIVIPHAAHHLDLRWSNPADPASVVAARAREFAVMDGWLADFAAAAAAHTPPRPSTMRVA